jgi:phosphatidylglycerol lysyltransferase
VPGGLGVFEAVMLLACTPHMRAEAVLGALLLYRGLYYVLPLVLATGLLAAYELRSGVAAPVGRVAVHLSPRLMAALALVAGLWLLVSGVTPASDEAAQLLAMKVPLPLVEASHFLGSVAGLGLLLVARGLLHQLDAAWWAALALSVVAAVLSLPKGIALKRGRSAVDARPAARHLAPTVRPPLLAVRAAARAGMAAGRRRRHRGMRLRAVLRLPGGPVRQPAVVAIRVRRQRATLAARAGGRGADRAGVLPVAAAASAGGRGGATDVCGNGARRGDRPRQPVVGRLLRVDGDKHLLFSPSGRSFLMFGKQGRSWISLFGPVGAEDEWSDLVWRFVETATAHGGRAAFYQVRPETLPLYLDCGLQVFKLGEHAHVPLRDFNLKGAKPGQPSLGGEPRRARGPRLRGAAA